MPLSPTMHAGRIAVIEDAVQAMTPDLGHGGRQGIEDAVVLARHLDSAWTKVTEALARYTAERLPRTTRVAATSRGVARMGQTSNRAVLALRNQALTLASYLPDAVTLGALTSTVGWQPPQS